METKNRCENDIGNRTEYSPCCKIAPFKHEKLYYCEDCMYDQFFKNYKTNEARKSFKEFLFDLIGWN